MGLRIFSAEWASEIKKRINSDKTYFETAQNWEWPVVLTIPDGDISENPAIYLDLWHGKCREAVPASTDQMETADFVLSANLETWLALYRSEIEIMPALLQGKVELVRGSYTHLIKNLKASRRIVEIIRDIEIENETNIIDSIPANSKPVTRTNREYEDPPERKIKTIDTGSYPYRLYQKAKKLGIWNPEDIDFNTDREHWNSFSDLEKEVIRHLTSLFLAGEESVTEDLLPLLWVISQERRLEEELYLTTFLFEEGKHTEFFNLFIKEVTGKIDAMDKYYDQHYRQLFHNLLPNSMELLLNDPSPAVLMNASVTYNMVVEGVMAETGYHAYHSMLEMNNLLPGLREGIQLVKQDESRHIAYGIYLLNRLLKKNPGLWNDLQQRMDYLLEIALKIIDGIFDRYEIMPFGLQREQFLDYAVSQFRKRLNKLEPE